MIEPMMGRGSEFVKNKMKKNESIKEEEKAANA